MTPPAAAVAEPLPRRRAPARRAPVRHPRRVSGPVPAPAPARDASPRLRERDRGVALRVLHAYQRIADSALLDRLARGRLWIGLLAFGLIGIVAMQLIVLKLNTGIGATLERAASLQRANAQLRIEAATSSGEGRIEPLAAASGMTFAPSGSVHFVASSPAADVARAAQALSQPIQPRESPVEASAAPAGEAAGAGGEGEASAAAPTPAAAGEATHPGEAGSGEAASHPSEAGSAEAGAPVEGHSPAASAAGTSEPEASAGAAGGVAAGH